MALNQFTDIQLKPWMKISANTVNAENMAIVNSSGIPTIIPASNVPTPVGVSPTAQSLNSSVLYVAPYGAPEIQYHQDSYFSSMGGSSSTAIANGTAQVAMTGQTVTGLNYTSFDGSNLVIAITGYYKIDYSAMLLWNVGTQILQFNLNVVVVGGSVLLNNGLTNPTLGVATIVTSAMVGGNGIIKLTAGQTIALVYENNQATGVATALPNIHLSLMLIDPVSA